MGKMSSVLITEEVLQNAWASTEASFWAFVKSGVTSRATGAIVVLDPTSGEIIFSATINEDGEEFYEFAEAKAKLSFREGESSREIGQRCPHLLQEGDVKYGGSAWVERLVVGFSGVQSEIDEFVASVMAHAIIAQCRLAMREIQAAKSPWIGV